MSQHSFAPFFTDAHAMLTLSTPKPGVTDKN